MNHAARILLKSFGAILCCIGLVGASMTHALAQATSDAAKRGLEILSEAAVAAGGEKLAKLTSLEFASHGTIQTQAGPTPIEVTVFIAYPDKVRTQNILPLGTLLSGFDGKTSWASSQQGTFSLPADLNAESVRSINLIGGFGIYKKCLAGKVEAEFAGQKEVAGQKTWLVEWDAPTGKVKLHFDQTTKMLVAANYRAATLQGVLLEERRWSDFRTVDGVKFPYHWMTYRDGALFSDQTVINVKLNGPVNATSFAKPQ
jgi:outer membrane lipoprotein-sorting protein